MNRLLHRSLPAVAALLLAGFPCIAAAASAGADDAAGGEGTKRKEKSWLVLPLFSSTPKLGTSLGVMGGGLHRFDERSLLSMAAFSAQYTSTDSALASLIAKGSFGGDRHRAKLSLSVGRVMNEYEDYLGTGIALKNVENARSFGGSYQRRIAGNWFAGVQAALKNYQVVGQSPGDDEALAALGIAGVKSGGVGALLQDDTRDNDNRPRRGWLLSLDNFAFREWLGSDYDYDLYRFDVRGFWGHGRGHVFALRQNNQWTVDAPSAAKSSVGLRGYKSGQYLGDNVSSLEAEERFHIARRWGATIFAGVGCLYGGGLTCTDGENLYPSYGAGIQFVLVPQEGIVGNLEYGRGKNDNSGAYLKLGYSF